MPELEVAGRKVRFFDAGSGELVLLLHSASGSAAQWRALTEAILVRAGLRVLAADLQGYGGSTPISTGREWSLGAFCLSSQRNEAVLIVSRGCAGGC